LEARAKILEILRRKNYNKQQFGGHLNKSVFSRNNPDLTNLFSDQLTKLHAKTKLVTSTELHQELKTYLKKNKLNNIYTFIPETTQFLKDNAYKVSAEFNENIQASITKCEALIARTGTILVSSRNTGRAINYFPEYHIIIAKQSQLVWDISDAIKHVQEKYGKDIPSMLTLVTGPSKTADIEKTLIIGAHGPKKLKVFIIKD
jgi:L-lactate dehydrogenase complex protein LldG